MLSTLLLGSDGPCQHHLAPAAGPVPPASGQLKHPPFRCSAGCDCLGDHAHSPSPTIWHRWVEMQLVARRQVGTPESQLLYMLAWDEEASVLQAPQGTPRPRASLGSAGREAEGQRSGTPTPGGQSAGPGSEAPECGRVAGVGAVLTSQWRGPLSLASPPVAGSCCPAAGHVPSQQL